MRWARAAVLATAMMVGAGAMSGLAGCSTSDSSQAAPEHAAATIGAHGGTVYTPNGSGVYIPTGALAANIAVTVDATPNAPKPSGATAVGTPYTFGPEGQEFSLPVRVTLAFDASSFPAGTTANDIVIYTAPVGTTQFVPLATSVADATHASALTMHFSVFVCVIPGVPIAQDAGGGDGGTDAGHDATTPGDGGPDATLGDSGDDGGGEAGPTGYGSDGAAEPPSAPDAAATSATTEHAFVIHAIHLGDEKDPVSAKPDWYELGYDIDGKTTTAVSTDVCTQAQDANKKNMADGNNGIDNSFGENLVPVLAAIATNPSATETAAIMNGTYTLMIDLKGLDEANLSQTATGLHGQVFGAVPFNQGPNAQGALPTFTTSDNWPLDPAFVTTGIADGGALANPVVSTEVFSSAYIANGTFVGFADEVSIAVAVGGAAMVLPVRHAVITFTNGGTHATSGVLAGVILTTDLVNAFAGSAGNINASFCPGSATFQTLVTTIEQAADIMHDGSNVAGTPCDAVSIGIGFTADEVGLPQVAGVPATTLNPCALSDAGDGG